MEAHTKKINCPEHLTHEATLHLHGHKYEGIWECDVDGTSDACEHESTHVETIETTPSSPIDVVYEARIYVCNVCECTTDGNPDEDKALALAEMAYDCE